jgi:hypothetical protein
MVCKFAPVMAKKSNTGKLLHTEKKKMTTGLLTKWREWATKEEPDMTDATWYQIIIGAYISKDNELFAIKALAKARELNKEHEEELAAAKESIKK